VGSDIGVSAVITETPGPGGRMPASPETARLEIPEGTPVFEVIRTYHTADGPLDVARFVIR
jgi:GntR family transcriptional regulator